MVGLIAPESLAAFTAVSLLLCISPGPDNLFVPTQSALYGRSAGVYVTLGLCAGLIVHTAAVAPGIAALIKASPLAFSLLKYAGAAYLLFLAWQTQHAGSDALTMQRADTPTAGRFHRRGIIMNVTNPKVTVFFLALLPQFADPDRRALW